jgi:hypothetical protein
MKSFLIRGAVPAALIVLGVALSGCATVTRSPSTDWAVNSLPAGAEVRISTGDYCEATPCSFHVRRKAPFVATLTAPGYEPGTVEVKPEIKPIGAVAFLGNGLIGGLIGAAVDIGTGAPLDPSHNGETVTLKPYSAQDLLRLGLAGEGCTREKAAYARQIGVPCDALSQRVVFNPGPLLTADSHPAPAAAQPAETASR